MERPPLPDPVARRARTYLAALVPPAETSDAWHELLADVTYWGDRDEVAVLRLAHQVVLQHERVTAEAAVLVLDEVGVTSPDAVAAVLDVGPPEAEALVQRVADHVAEAEQSPDVHVFDAEAGAVGTRAPRDDEPDGAAETTEPAEVPEPVDAREPADAPEPVAAGEPAPRPEPTGEAGAPASVQIGFDDDEVLELDDDASLVPVDRRRWWAAAAIAVVALLLLWFLLG